MYHKSVILNIVTDEQLLISIIAGTVIIISAILGILLNIYYLFQKNRQKNKSVRIVLLIAFAVITVFLIREVKNNYALYKNSTLITGKVTGFCKTARGEDGVSFEYIFNNQLYSNCDVYFPFPKDSIRVGDSYPVKINIRHPEMGRIIFK